MSGLGLGNISEKQEKAVIALLAQPTIGLAAKAAGVGERTLHTWLDEPGFVRAYCAARRKAFKHAVSLAQHYAPLAVQNLARICNNEKAPAAARVTAAAYLLKFGRDSIELEDLQARIDLIEASMGISSKPLAGTLGHGTEPIDTTATDSTPPALPTQAAREAVPPAGGDLPPEPPPRVRRGRKPGKPAKRPARAKARPA